VLRGKSPAWFRARPLVSFARQPVLACNKYAFGVAADENGDALDRIVDEMTKQKRDDQKE
jgi:hypothetical protein